MFGIIKGVLSGGFLTAGLVERELAGHCRAAKRGFSHCGTAFEVGQLQLHFGTNAGLGGLGLDQRGASGGLVAVGRINLRLPHRASAQIGQQLACFHRVAFFHQKLVNNRLARGTHGRGHANNPANRHNAALRGNAATKRVRGGRCSTDTGSLRPSQGWQQQRTRQDGGIKGFP